MEHNKDRINNQENIPIMEEILSRPSHWLLRSGISIIGSMIALLFVISCTIKYPDLLTAPVEIVSDNPIQYIISNTSGYIDNVFAHDGDTLYKGMPVAVLQSETSYADICILREWIHKNAQNTLLQYPEKPQTFLCNSSSCNGSLRSALFELQQNYYEYYVKATAGNDSVKLKWLQIECAKIVELKEKSTQLYNTNTDIYNLAYTQFLRDSLLFTSKVIAQKEYDNSLLKLIGATQEKEKFYREVLGYDLEQQRITAEFHKTKNNSLMETKWLRMKILQGITQLQSKINEWEYLNLLTAPDSGIFHLNQYWSQGQFITKYEKIFSILPCQGENLYARIEVNGIGLGKISIGNHVYIRLNNYPYKEYGTISGIISSIPESHIEGKYIVIAKIPGDLVTSYGHELHVVSGMQGNAKIVTDSKRFINRIINPIKSIIKN